MTSQLVSQAQIAQFHRDGAIQLKGVFPREWLDILENGLDDAFNRPGPMAVKVKKNVPNSNGLTHIDQFPSAHSPALRRVIEESPLASIVGQLLNSSIRLYMDQMFYKLGGYQLPTAWHQDTIYYNVGGNDLIRTWVCVDRVPRTASMQVVRGSHRWNVTYRPVQYADKAGRDSAYQEEGSDKFSYSAAPTDTTLPEVPDIELFRDSFEILNWDYEPGDVLVFNGHILHGALGDVTLDHPRRAHATLWAGDDVHYVKRPGQVIPDPPGLSGATPGQRLSDFPDLFPTLWAPT